MIYMQFYIRVLSTSTFCSKHQLKTVKYYIKCFDNINMQQRSVFAISVLNTLSFISVFNKQPAKCGFGEMKNDLL